MRHKILTIVVGGLLIAGFVPVSAALAGPAKTWLTKQLIERAWQQTRQGEVNTKPWPWLDSVPVARLAVPRLNKDFIIMRGTAGTVLALTPGWHDGTAPPGTPGISLITAHRNTHFGFLRDMQKGDVIRLQLPQGAELLYEVKALKIAMTPEVQVEYNNSRNSLLLSTSFPVVNGPPGRQIYFVVVARPIEDKQAITS